MKKIRCFLAKYLPWAGKYKRYVVALKDHFGPAKASYSQHGEDKFILKAIRDQGLDIAQSIYVDIGANHPTDISNTYLLYRNGFQGVLIEANAQLCELLKCVRKRDVVINVGASDKAGIGQFNISKTPVRSSFLNRDS